ncbi:hypothetical protein [Streptomyces sp. HD]|uniref:hypothetical protein n=1 Tax=Streptomyces sp. HD TaxID=3020892 RepID=UPI002FEE2B3E
MTLQRRLEQEFGHHTTISAPSLVDWPQRSGSRPVAALGRAQVPSPVVGVIQWAALSARRSAASEEVGAFLFLALVAVVGLPVRDAFGVILRVRERAIDARHERLRN